MPPLIKRPRLRASAISPSQIHHPALVPWWRRKAEEFLMRRRHHQDLGLLRQRVPRQHDMRILAALDREAIFHPREEILQLGRPEIMDRDDESRLDLVDHLDDV